jgi:hypothetical protein
VPTAPVVVCDQTGHQAPRAAMCINTSEDSHSLHQSLMMEAERVSKTMDTNSIFTCLIIREDFIAKFKTFVQTNINYKSLPLQFME